MTFLIQSSVVGVCVVASLAWPAAGFAQPRATQQAAVMADFSARVTCLCRPDEDARRRVCLPSSGPTIRRRSPRGKSGSAMPSVRDGPAHGPGTS